MLLQRTTIVLLLLLLSTSLSAAPLVIQITEGFEDAAPIAIVPFGHEGARKPPVDIASVVTNDLVSTGRFKALPQGDMLAKPTDAASVKFQNWRIMSIENLVIGKVKYLGADSYVVSFWLFDVFKEKQVIAFNVSGTENSLRATAHQISDIIYKELTGEPGAFSTRIAYVTAEGVNSKRSYSLWLADADGANPQELLKSHMPIMSPSWSPDGTRIAYASLEQSGRQRVFVQEWNSGRREEIKVDKPGLHGAPSWSPKGDKLALVVIHNGNADLYSFDLATKRAKALTHHWAIDTEPVWTPDGASIIFTSDRGGRPQLYKISADGGRAQRLTYEGQENLRASIAPDGKSLAMVHKNDGKYGIAVMELETGVVRVLTKGALDESPSFAPNGSMLIYATSAGDRGALAWVSLSGRVPKTLAPGDVEVREPSWSPFNKK